MTVTLADLQATEASLKANGWSEGNLRWWRRSAYAEAGLAVPQSGPSTRSIVTTSTKQPETGADWAKRLKGAPLAAMKRDDDEGDDDRKAAAARLAKDAISSAVGPNKNASGESGAEWAARLTGKKGRS